MYSVVMAFSNFQIVGCIDTLNYNGVEYSYPQGFKELLDKGIPFDVVDVNLPFEEMASAYIKHFKPTA